MNIALLCFGISSISSVSGMEKVYVEMANAFVQRGHRVWTVWNDKPGVVPYYPFDNRVEQVNLSLGKIKAPLGYKILREINKGLHINAVNKVDQYKTDKLCQEIQKHLDLSKVDIFICYEFNSVMVANRLSKGRIPVVAMVHNSIDDQIAALTPLQREEASKADVYQVLMPSYVAQAEKLLTTKIKYIPNVVPKVDAAHCADLSITKERYRIVHVGRVEGRQKRQLILIRCFAKIAKDFPDWDIYFYGPMKSKEYKEKIDRFVEQEGIGSQIHFEGVTKDVLKELSRGDIFAFPSAYEGFSLALTEAMAVGLPVVRFSYAPSVQELIEDGVDGYLVEDEDEFTERLAELMKNQSLRMAMGKAAKTAMMQYAPDVVWDTWEQLVRDLVNRKKERSHESTG